MWMYSSIFLTLITLMIMPACAVPQDKAEPQDKPTIVSIQKIWDRADHNAFTDLIFFKNHFFCCFREANNHAGGTDGKIRILMSDDAQIWSEVALIESPGTDLRDPMLSEMPDGRLMLTMGGSVYEGTTFITRNPAVAFSTEGSDWTPVEILKDLPGEWIWRVTWDNGIGYGASYSFTDNNDDDKPWLLKLFKTLDGIHYEFVVQLDVPNFPNETTLRFLPDHTMVALTRRGGFGWIGSAPPPYTEWKWFETNERLGGPNFLILPNQKMWASSRHFEKTDHKHRKPTTILARMGLDFYEPVLTLPSGGDCSYPGMVYHNGKLYLSYYSSHEGKSSIYCAIITLPE